MLECFDIVLCVKVDIINFMFGVIEFVKVDLFNKDEDMDCVCVFIVWIIFIDNL